MQKNIYIYLIFDVRDRKVYTGKHNLKSLNLAFAALEIMTGGFLDCDQPPRHKVVDPDSDGRQDPDPDQSSDPTGFFSLI